MTLLYAIRMETYRKLLSSSMQDNGLFITVNILPHPTQKSVYLLRRSGDRYLPIYLLHFHVVSDSEITTPV